jgi:alkanesulfonate monooxygenase SsuD/methylene tetrahydromethanopterin reductase-like flavin-dependent oxidoreductase (luciferase family)
VTEASPSRGTVAGPAAALAGAADDAPASVRVGMFPPADLLEQGPETARAFLAQVGEAEIDHSGVDPATRGARMDECLTVVRQLLTGAAVTFQGAFIDIEEAMISPAPAPIPIVIGGRSDVAVRRAGRLGDGWLGVWISPRRFAAAAELAAEEAARAGRADPPARHAMQVWCGLAGSREAARGCLAPVMQAYYQLPFERFERYCPYGTAEDVAGFLAPYVAAGCAEFNLIPQSPDYGQAIAGVAAVKKLLART